MIYLRRIESDDSVDNLYHIQFVHSGADGERVHAVSTTINGSVENWVNENLSEIRNSILATQAVEVNLHGDEPVFLYVDDIPFAQGYYKQKIDDIQANEMVRVVGADMYRLIIYILKFLELMSAQLGLQKITDSIILGHESGGGLAERQALADTWSAKSGAWLDAVGKSEAAASAAKASISACDNVDDMQTIVDGFPAALETALNG